MNSFENVAIESLVRLHNESLRSSESGCFVLKNLMNCQVAGVFFDLSWSEHLQVNFLSLEFLLVPNVLFERGAFPERYFFYSQIKFMMPFTFWNRNLKDNSNFYCDQIFLWTTFEHKETVVESCSQSKVNPCHKNLDSQAGRQLTINNFEAFKIHMENVLLSNDNALP